MNRRRAASACLVGTACLFLLATSCGTVADFAVDKAIEPKKTGEETSPDVPTVDITTGGHSHTFSKGFIADVRRLEKDDPTEWALARTGFENLLMASPAPEDRVISAARYGIVMADTLSTIRSLNEINTMILVFLGQTKKGSARMPGLFVSPAGTARLPDFEAARRHGRGDIVHTTLENLVESELLGPVERGIESLKIALKEPDFMFPIESFSLGIDVGELKAHATFRGYHNKVVAQSLLQAFRFFGMAGEFLNSIRDPGKILTAVATNPDLSGLSGPLLVGKGGRAVVSLFNADDALLRFYPEHLKKVEDYFLPWVTEGSAFEPVFAKKDYLDDHYAPAFAVRRNIDGKYELRVESEQTETSGGILLLGSPETYDTLTGEGRAELQRHLNDPTSYPLVKASTLLKGALANTSFVFNKILGEVVVSSLIKGTGAAAPPSGSVESFLDSVNSVLETIGGIHLGVEKDIFQVNVYRLFEVLTDLRDYVPAWARSSAGQAGYFFVEFECGEKEPSVNTARLDSSGVKCRPDFSLEDTDHFQNVAPTTVGGESRKVGGISLDDTTFASNWGTGVPRDGKKSPYNHLLWQDPAFGGAVFVDPSALKWSQYGVSLSPGATVPCGVEPSVQGLKGPAGVCLLNLLLDILGSSS